MEMIKFIRINGVEISIWRSRDAEGRRTYDWTITESRREPMQCRYLSQRAAIEDARDHLAIFAD